MGKLISVTHCRNCKGTGWVGFQDPYMAPYKCEKCDATGHVFEFEADNDYECPPVVVAEVPVVQVTKTHEACESYISPECENAPCPDCDLNHE